jgi:hypothetical protein
MQAESSETVVVVNVCCTAYSGGTWFNLMLGSHPDGFSIGEMKWLRRMNEPTCTLHGRECPIWSRFDLNGDENPFLQLHRITGKRFLAVNQSRKFLVHQRDPRIKSKFVHFVRDGRAVMASILRKYSNRPAWKVARLWAHNIRRNARLIARQPQADTCMLNYEALKADPARQLQKVCDAIGMPFVSGMTEYWNHEHHYIGGNRGTLLSLVQKRNDRVAVDQLQNAEPLAGSRKGPQWDMNYYAGADPTKFVDERWKKELTDAQLRIFALIAGRLNRKYGYPPSMDRHAAVAERLT